MKDIERISQLQANWDQRGASPANPRDVLDALEFLDRVMAADTRSPRIAPLSNGGIEVLWRGEQTEVEAVFDQQRGDRCLMVEVGEQGWESAIDDADSLFLSVRDRLSDSETLLA
jgi:hypothetical protein